MVTSLVTSVRSVAEVVPPIASVDALGTIGTLTLTVSPTLLANFCSTDRLQRLAASGLSESIRAPSCATVVVVIKVLAIKPSLKVFAHPKGGC